MSKIPKWLKNYRIKTIEELKEEFSQAGDQGYEWRDRTPLSFVVQMDETAGKKIKDLKEDLFSNCIGEQPTNKDHYVFRYRGWNYSFSMLKNEFKPKLKKILKL